jgi:hypothetical protein
MELVVVIREFLVGTQPQDLVALKHQAVEAHQAPQAPLGLVVVAEVEALVPTEVLLEDLVDLVV